jgi:hypothetical protein
MDIHIPDELKSKTSSLKNTALQRLGKPGADGIVKPAHELVDLSNLSPPLRRQRRAGLIDSDITALMDSADLGPADFKAVLEQMLTRRNTAPDMNGVKWRVLGLQQGLRKKLHSALAGDRHQEAWHTLSALHTVTTQFHECFIPLATAMGVPNAIEWWLEHSAAGDYIPSREWDCMTALAAQGKHRDVFHHYLTDANTTSWLAAARQQYMPQPAVMAPGPQPSLVAAAIAAAANTNQAQGPPQQPTMAQVVANSVAAAAQPAAAAQAPTPQHVVLSINVSGPGNHSQGGGRGGGRHGGNHGGRHSGGRGNGGSNHQQPQQN